MEIMSSIVGVLWMFADEALRTLCDREAHPLEKALSAFVLLCYAGTIIAGGILVMLIIS
jgi:hypothetical protein